MTNLTSLALLLLSAGLTGAIPCYAPANSWGPPCTWPSPVAGQKGTYVNYHVGVLTPSTTVYCQAVGMANYIHGTSCFWGWHDLGAVNNQYVSLIWDSNNSYPSLRCYAVPIDSNLDWGVTVGVAALTCQSATHPFLNKITTDVDFDEQTAIATELA